eukprot:6191773-Pleurochrysis_carterae.AAC.2
MVREAGSSSRSAFPWTRTKRARSVGGSVQSVCSLFNAFSNRPSTIHTSGYVFDLQQPGEGERLIDELWRG